MSPITLFTLLLGFGLQVINILSSGVVDPNDLGSYGEILKGFRSIDRTVSTVNLLNPISLVGGLVSGLVAGLTVLKGIGGLLLFDLHFFTGTWGLIARSFLILLSVVSMLEFLNKIRGSA